MSKDFFFLTDFRKYFFLTISLFFQARNAAPPGGPPGPYLPGAPGGRQPFSAKYVNGKPPAFLARGHVKHIKVKGKKGKKGRKETYDLIVNIDLVSLTDNII